MGLICISNIDRVYCNKVITLLSLVNCDILNRFLVMWGTCKMLLRWKGLDCAFESIIVALIWEIDKFLPLLIINLPLPF